jgi:ABC-2 type transport system ATP-binding protein
MVHDPDILVLDEPTAGVDIELRQQLWANVKKLNEAGKTILLTTHYLEEAEQLCNKIAIINHGKIVANEDKDTLLGRVEGKEVTFRVDRPLEEIPVELKGFNARIEGQRRLVISFNPSEANMGDMINALQKSSYQIVDISTDHSDLEDVFLQITRSK